MVSVSLWPMSDHLDFSQLLREVLVKGIRRSRCTWERGCPRHTCVAWRSTPVDIGGTLPEMGSNSPFGEQWYASRRELLGSVDCKVQGRAGLQEQLAPGVRRPSASALLRVCPASLSWPHPQAGSLEWQGGLSNPPVFTQQRSNPQERGSLFSS